MSDVFSVDIFKDQQDDESVCKNVYEESGLRGWSLCKTTNSEDSSKCNTCDTSLTELLPDTSREHVEENYNLTTNDDENNETTNKFDVTTEKDVDNQLEEEEEKGKKVEDVKNNCKWTKVSLKSDISNDKEEPLELLPPDHPLLRKFQQSLKEYLSRSKEQLINEIDELKYNIKLKETERENCGATLYDMQNEIDRQNEQLEDYSIQIEEHVEKRRKEEELVLSLKTEHEQQMQLLREEKKFYNQRMIELEHMQVLELNIRKWVDEVEEEVKNAQRVVSRDDQLQKQLSQDKKKSDLLLYHLDSEIKKSQKELQLLQNEVEDMTGVLNSLRMSTAAANADLEVLEDEHKHLSQAWGEVIVAISLRDRILYQAQTDIKKVKEEIKNNICGIEAAQKLIKKELKLNEKLMVFKKNLADSLGGLRNQCKQQSDVLNGLEKSLLEIPDILLKTEEEMKIARNEGLAIERELRRFQTVIDQWNNKKFMCEESILKLAQDQLVNDKASAYRIKLIRNAQGTRRGLELTLSQSQNQLASVLLQIEYFKSRIAKYTEESNRLKIQYDELEKKSNLTTKELKRYELDIDLKMKRMEKLNNQVDSIKRSGGTMASGTELKIKLEEKVILELEADIRKAQELWIMLQNHYVNLTDKRNVQLNEVQMTKKQLSIIKQKSIKLDLELEKAEDNARDINREIRNQQKILEQMDLKIYKNHEQQETEKKHLELEQGDLIEKFKANEMEVLQLEETINEQNTEIAHYKDLVLDKHREALSWETKYKLIEETLMWRKDTNASNSEITSMRKEIHRMKIRYQQLKRIQEKLNQDLEHAVMHREHMFIVDSTRKSIEAQKKHVKQSSQTLRHRINDLRGKLKHQQSQFELTHRQIEASQTEHREIQTDVYHVQKDVEQAIKDIEHLKVDIENAVIQKHINLERLIRTQRRSKWYRRLSQFTTTDKLARSESTILTLHAKQREIKENLIKILQMVKEDYPNRLNDFNKLLYVLEQN